MALLWRTEAAGFLRSGSPCGLAAHKLAVELKMIAYQAGHQEALTDRASGCRADVIRQARVSQESNHVIGAALSRLDQVAIVPVLDLEPYATHGCGDHGPGFPHGLGDCQTEAFAGGLLQDHARG